MNATVCVQIGNTDNKLTQQNWAKFVGEVMALIDLHSWQKHFFGGSSTFDPWQNVCWVFSMPQEQIENFQNQLKPIGALYGQSSIAILAGEVFLMPCLE